MPLAFQATKAVLSSLSEESLPQLELEDPFDFFFFFFFFFELLLLPFFFLPSLELLLPSWEDSCRLELCGLRMDLVLAVVGVVLLGIPSVECPDACAQWRERE